MNILRNSIFWRIEDGSKKPPQNLRNFELRTRQSKKKWKVFHFFFDCQLERKDRRRLEETTPESSKLPTSNPTFKKQLNLFSKCFWLSSTLRRRCAYTGFARIYIYIYIYMYHIYIYIYIYNTAMNKNEREAVNVDTALANHQCHQDAWAFVAV